MITFLLQPQSDSHKLNLSPHQIEKDETVETTDLVGDKEWWNYGIGELKIQKRRLRPEIQMNSLPLVIALNFGKVFDQTYRQWKSSCLWLVFP
jgi:hypothetical protein